MARPAGAATHGVVRQRVSPCGDGRRRPRCGRVSAVRCIPGVLLLLRWCRVHPVAREGPRSAQGDLSVLHRTDPHVAGPPVREAAQLRDADGRLPEASVSRVILWSRVTATFVLMSLGALVMLAVALPT